MPEPHQTPRRTPRGRWVTLLALLALTGVGSWLLATTGSPPDQAAESLAGTVTEATTFPSGTDGTDPNVLPGLVAGNPGNAATASRDGHHFERDADGNYVPTGAGSDAYPRYLGGDFDDTSHNDVPSFGVDENGCDANYAGACVPPPPARTDCAELGVANFEVINGDPHGLDPDGDGIACDDETVIRTRHGEETEEPRD